MEASSTASETAGENEFDLIIIGAGSGNTIPDERFADLKIAIIDDGEHFGGTCLNVGCIPTKMFVRPAEIVHGARSAQHLGVTAPDVRANWAAVRDRIFTRIDAISNSGEEYRRSGEPNIQLVRERVRFVSDHELETDSGRRLRAERVIIAAGSRSFELDPLPWSQRVITNAEALRLEQLPQHITVIGGGAIGCEFANIFHGFGAKTVQLVRSMPLKSVDSEVAATFAQVADWDLRTGTEVTAAHETEAGVELTLSDGSQMITDLVLVAAGRIPNSDRLEVTAAGFDLHEDGRIVVDDYQRVLRDGEPVPGVWALGDISSPHQLKHVANEEARVVAHNVAAELSGEQLRRNTLGPVPTAVFSNPEVAAFGESLSQAQARGADAFAVRHDYGATAWGWALEDETSFCKLVVDRENGKLLGAQIIGPDAAILLQPLIQAASQGQSVRGLARQQYWPHPAATEIIENTLLRAEAQLAAH